MPSVFAPTTFDDGVSGGGQVNTLRDAVIAANRNTTGSGTDVIQLSAGTYMLSVQNTSGPADAMQGDLNLTNTTHTLVIEGADSTHPTATVIDASQLNDRVFQVDPGVTVRFENLVIQGGHAFGDPPTPRFDPAKGGGVRNDGGYVTLSNVVVQSNQAATHDSLGGGGGIYSAGGTLTLTNTVVKDNIASSDYNPSANVVTTSQGGGIDAEGSLVSITNSLIAGNQAVGGHGSNPTHTGLGVTGGGGGAALGGGLYVANGSVQIATTTISGNTARGGDGGNGGVDGGNGGAGGYADGGGVYLGPGEVTVRDSTVSGNFVVGGNGGLGHSNSSGGPFGGNGGNGGTGGGADGGGFHVQDGTLILINTTVANNNPYSGAGGDGGNGGITSRGGDGGNGGVAWGGGIGNARTLDTFNVTIAGNFVWAGAGGAPGIGAGGAPSGVQGLIGSTQGGGIWNDGSNPVNLINTIIATNIATSGPDFIGTVTSSDHTLIGDNKDAIGFNAVQNGDIVGTPNARIDPLLGPLQDNGGPTQTMALLGGSPAIDHGDTSAVSATGPNDQRGDGFARLVNSIIDIGAVEFCPAAVTTTADNVVTNVSQAPPPQASSGNSSASNPSPPNAGIVGLAIEEFELTIDQILSDIEGMLGMSHAGLDATIAQMQTAIQTDVSFSTPLGQEAVSLGQSLAFSSLSHS